MSRFEHRNDTVEEELDDIENLVEGVQQRAVNEVTREEPFGYHMPTDTIHRACWLLAAVADDVGYSFDGRYSTLVEKPIALDEYVDSEKERIYDSEEELRAAVTEVVEALDGFYRELAEYVDKADIGSEEPADALQWNHRYVDSVTPDDS